MKTAASKARQAQGDKSHQAILEEAVHLASVEGLEGLTIGRLATAIGMSKSGLFAHFGSKEGLQLATVEAARSIFVDKVIAPAFKAEKGLARLNRLCDIWFDYAESHVFRGGCFFAAAASEFDSRPGRVRDRIAEIMREWFGLLSQSISEAQEAKEFDPTVDPVQLAFEINSLEIGANWALQLFDDQNAFKRAREAVFARLKAHSRRRKSGPKAPGKKRKAS